MPIRFPNPKRRSTHEHDPFSDRLRTLYGTFPQYKNRDYRSFKSLKPLSSDIRSMLRQQLARSGPFDRLSSEQLVQYVDSMDEVSFLSLLGDSVEFVNRNRNLIVLDEEWNNLSSFGIEGGTPDSPADRLHLLSTGTHTSASSHIATYRGLGSLSSLVPQNRHKLSWMEDLLSTMCNSVLNDCLYSVAFRDPYGGRLPSGFSS
jgi:hypothetical protein